jgi:hypothetical protein
MHHEFVEADLAGPGFHGATTGSKLRAFSEGGKVPTPDTGILRIPRVSGTAPGIGSGHTSRSLRTKGVQLRTGLRTDSGHVYGIEVPDTSTALRRLQGPRNA